MLTKEAKLAIIKEFGENENDSGKTEVQIALLTARIKYLTEHRKANPNDGQNLRGLQRLVDQRKSMLRYLKGVDYKRYVAVVKKLGLRG